LIVHGLQLLEIARHARIDLGDHFLDCCVGKGTPLGVDGSQLTAIDRHQPTATQIVLCAQQRQYATDFASWCEVVMAQVSDRLVIGPRLFEQPHQFHVALRLLLYAPARPYAVKITVNGALEQGARMRARAPGGRRHRVAKTLRFKGKGIDKRIHETHRAMLCCIPSAAAPLRPARPN
jgi:hypothetical protein